MRYKLRSGNNFSSGPECAGLLIAIAFRSSPGMMVVGISVTVCCNPKSVEALSTRVAFPRTEEMKLSGDLKADAG